MSARSLFGKWSQKIPVRKKEVNPKESKTGTQTSTCMCMFTTAHFTIDGRWKQLRYSSTDKGINIRIHPQNEILPSSARDEVQTRTAMWLNL